MSRDPHRDRTGCAESDRRERENALYADLPRGWDTITTHKAARTADKDHLYRDHVLEVPCIPELKLYGTPDEDRAAFLGRARLAVREERELEEDRAEPKSRKGQELLSAGETLLGMFGVLGRKRSTGLSTAARKRLEAFWR